MPIPAKQLNYLDMDEVFHKLWPANDDFERKYKLFREFVNKHWDFEVLIVEIPTFLQMLYKEFMFYQYKQEYKDTMAVVYAEVEAFRFAKSGDFVRIN